MPIRFRSCFAVFFKPNKLKCPQILSEVEAKSFGVLKKEEKLRHKLNLDCAPHH